MNILVIPGYYGFGGRGGFGASGKGLFFRDQASALARNGHHVFLMYVHFDADRGVEVEEVVDDGIRCIYIHAAPLPLRVNASYKVALLIRTAKRYFKGQPIDLIHAHTFVAGHIARMLASAMRIPYVITEHSSRIHTGISLPRRLLARWGYAGASRVIAVSSGLSKAMRRYTRREITVIPNLVRHEFLSSSIENPISNHFRFVSVGRSDLNKGWDILIQAFAPLVDSGADVTLTLAGGGESSQLKKLASRLGVSDRITFTGPLSHHEVLNHLRSCDCHILASRFETFGIVSIEALALGKPIIMTRTDAANDIVNEGNGVVAEVEDIQDLHSAMCHMVARRRCYDATAIRIDCSARFSEEAVTNRLTHEYQHIARDASLR